MDHSKNLATNIDTGVGKMFNGWGLRGYRLFANIYPKIESLFRFAWLISPSSYWIFYSIFWKLTSIIAIFVLKVRLNIRPFVAINSNIVMFLCTDNLYYHVKSNCYVTIYQLFCYKGIYQSHCLSHPGKFQRRISLHKRCYPNVYKLLFCIMFEAKKIQLNLYCGWLFSAAKW